MTGVIAHVAGLFVEPAVRSGPPVESPAAAIGRDDEGSPGLRPEGGRAPVVAVLAQPSDVRAAAGAVALGLLQRTRAGAAVICVWSDRADDEVAVRAPATPAAARAGAALAADGLATSTSGRLAVVRLPAPEAAAVDAARRATGAGLPVVVAVGAPRGAAFERFLSSVDLVIVGLTADAVEGLAEVALPRGTPGALLELDAGVVGRVLAATGVGLARSLQAPVAQALATLA